MIDHEFHMAILEPPRRLSPEECAEWQEVAGEFSWPETDDDEWDFLRPGREPGE
jgi:hypothetical protein